ncbi:hypothetical protein HK405_014446 [Cladochytrium tenue]|nr:hypothetical protein HK405_014446 [Cladochytrium tenue]
MSSSTFSAVGLTAIAAVVAVAVAAVASRSSSGSSDRAGDDQLNLLTVDGRPMSDMRASKRAKAALDRYPRDTLVLHAFGRPSKGWGAPSFSPYVIKLEMYLRATGTPHVVFYTQTPSCKGGMPYLTYNELEVPDTHFAIQWLEKEGFSKGLDGGLDPIAVSNAEAYRVMVINLGEIIAMWRWTHPSNARFAKETMMVKAPQMIRPIAYSRVTGKLRARHWDNGHGRHSRREVVSLADSQLSALSALLADGRDYLLGTPGPTSLDCAAYGVLVQYVVCSSAKVHADAVAAGFKEMGVPLGAREVARGVTPELVRYVRRIGEKWFGEFAGNIAAATWEAVEAEATERHLIKA